MAVATRRRGGARKRKLDETEDARQGDEEDERLKAEEEEITRELRPLKDE